MDLSNDGKVFVSKFQIGENKLYYAKVLWKPNEHDLFKIKIYPNNETTWTGRFSNEFAQKYRERINESEEEYVQNIRKALTGDDPMYTYDLTPTPGDNKTHTFQWHRTISNGMLVHGCVPLHCDENTALKEELLDILLLQNKDLQKTIDNLHICNDKINKDLEKCKNELEKFVNIKTSIEKSLYGKFVQLLNAKKRRIQVLEENLSKLEGPNKTISDSELD